MNNDWQLNQPQNPVQWQPGVPPQPQNQHVLGKAQQNYQSADVTNGYNGQGGWDQTWNWGGWDEPQGQTPQQNFNAAPQPNVPNSGGWNNEWTNQGVDYNQAYNQTLPQGNTEMSQQMNYPGAAPYAAPQGYQNNIQEQQNNTFHMNSYPQQNYGVPGQPNQYFTQNQQIVNHSVGLDNHLENSGGSASAFAGLGDSGGLGYKMEEISLNDDSNAKENSAHENSNVLPASNSFSQLPHEPSPFDNLGNSQDSFPSQSFGSQASGSMSGIANQNQPNLSVPPTTQAHVSAHSRDSSLGGNVQFIVGSDPPSASESPSQHETSACSNSRASSTAGAADFSHEESHSAPQPQQFPPANSATLPVHYAKQTPCGAPSNVMQYSQNTIPPQVGLQQNLPSETDATQRSLFSPPRAPSVQSSTSSEVANITQGSSLNDSVERSPSVQSGTAPPPVGAATSTYSGSTPVAQQPESVAIEQPLNMTPSEQVPNSVPVGPPPTASNFAQVPTSSPMATSSAPGSAPPLGIVSPPPPAPAGASTEAANPFRRGNQRPGYAPMQPPFVPSPADVAASQAPPFSAAVADVAPTQPFQQPAEIPSTQPFEAAPQVMRQSSQPDVNTSGSATETHVASTSPIQPHAGSLFQPPQKAPQYGQASPSGAIETESAVTQIEDMSATLRGQSLTVPSQNNNAVQSTEQSTAHVPPAELNIPADRSSRTQLDTPDEYKTSAFYQQQKQKQREHMFSPPTTLWANPEPEVVKLAPAALTQQNTPNQNDVTGQPSLVQPQAVPTQISAENPPTQFSGEQAASEFANAGQDQPVAANQSAFKPVQPLVIQPQQPAVLQQQPPTPQQQPPTPQQQPFMSPQLHSANVNAGVPVSSHYGVSDVNSGVASGSAAQPGPIAAGQQPQVHSHFQAAGQNIPSFAPPVNNANTDSSLNIQAVAQQPTSIGQEIKPATNTTATQPVLGSEQIVTPPTNVSSGYQQVPITGSQGCQQPITVQQGIAAGSGGFTVGVNSDLHKFQNTANTLSGQHVNQQNVAQANVPNQTAPQNMHDSVVSNQEVTTSQAVSSPAQAVSATPFSNPAETNVQNPHAAQVNVTPVTNLTTNNPHVLTQKTPQSGSQVQSHSSAQVVSVPAPQNVASYFTGQTGPNQNQNVVQQTSNNEPPVSQGQKQEPLVSPQATFTQNPLTPQGTLNPHDKGAFSSVSSGPQQVQNTPVVNAQSGVHSNPMLNQGAFHNPHTNQPPPQVQQTEQVIPPSVNIQPNTPQSGVPNTQENQSITRGSRKDSQDSLTQEITPHSKNQQNAPRDDRDNRQYSDNRNDPRYDRQRSDDSRQSDYDRRDPRYRDDYRHDRRDPRYDSRYDRGYDRNRDYDRSASYDRDWRYDPRYDPYRDPRYDYNYDPYRPPSRSQGYETDPYARPNSRQGYPDERSSSRPSSRQGYPEGSRQEDPYQRSNSRQGYDGYRDRYGYPDRRPHSRSGYEESYDRPRSRQDYSVERSSSRGPVDDTRSASRPSSRQGYPEDSERPRSRQAEYDYERRKQCEQYRNDPRYRDYYSYADYNREYDYYHRREQRYAQGYEQEMRQYAGYPQDYQNQSGGYYDQYGYYRTNSYDYDRHSQHSQSRGTTPSADQALPRHPSFVLNKSLSIYREPSRGYYLENWSYGELPSPGLSIIASSEVTTSIDNEVPFNSPVVRQLKYDETPLTHDKMYMTPIDQFAREFHHGSRPSSRQEYEQSPIYPPADASHHGYYHQSYADQSYNEYGSRRYEPEPEPEPARRTPLKHMLAHVKGTLPADGKLLRMLPNSPAEGQPATVEFANISDMLVLGPEAEQLKAFPGPLVRGETHKNDVLQWCQQRAKQCREDTNMVDKENAALLWRYLELLIKQNGTVVATDVAELLMEGHEQSALNLPMAGIIDQPVVQSDCDVTDTSNRSLINTMATQTALDRFRQLCLFGRKKEALEFAMKSNLWAQALFLAMRMGPRISGSVTTRFMNSAMSVNDPLRTMYQLMSGWQPAACSMVADDRFGDWRPHLAIILSHPSDRPDLDKKSIIAMGDAFAGKGYLYASQLCYLMAKCHFQEYSKKTAKLVLLSSSHSLPFEQFASDSAIQCTEVYEYAMSLGSEAVFLAPFQLYKFFYTIRLIDIGLMEEALRYCEVLANMICQYPSVFNANFVHQVSCLGDRLKYHDPQRQHTAEELPDPQWLLNIQTVDAQFQSGQIEHVTPVSHQSDTRASSEVAEITQGVQSLTQGLNDMHITSGANVQSHVANNDVYSNTAVTSQAQEVTQQTDHAQQEVTSQGQVQEQAEQTIGEYHNGWQWDRSQQQWIWVGQQQDQQLQQDQQQQLEQTTNYDGSYMGYIQQNAEQNTQDMGGFPAEPSVTEEAPPTQFTQPIIAEETTPPTDNFNTDNVDFYENATQQSVQTYVETEESDSSDDSSSSGSESPNDSPRNTPNHHLLHNNYAPPTSKANPFSYHSEVSPYLQRQRTLSNSSNGSQGSLSYITQQNYPSFSYPLPNIEEGSRGTSPPTSPGSLSSNTSTPKATSGGYFQFGVAPPVSPIYRPSDSSAPLGGTQSSTDTEPVGQKKKPYWPGEDDEDMGKIGTKTDAKIDKSKNKDADKDKKGLLSRMFGWGKSKKEIHLPDDKNKDIIWDEDKKRWVDTTKDEDEVDPADIPPPKDSDMLHNMTAPAIPSTPAGQSGPGMVTSASANRFSRQNKTRGARGSYVDVLGGKAKPAPSAPASLFNVLPKSQSVPANIFNPAVAKDPLHSKDQIQNEHITATEDQTDSQTDNSTSQTQGAQNNQSEAAYNQNQGYNAQTQPYGQNQGYGSTAPGYGSTQNQGYGAPTNQYAYGQNTNYNQYGNTQQTRSNQDALRKTPEDTLSRWSSQSSLASEVQYYMQPTSGASQSHPQTAAVSQQPPPLGYGQAPPQAVTEAPTSNQGLMPPPSSGMQFYNPTNFTAPQSGSARGGLSRYGQKRPSYTKQ